jgi:hypothetical protein
LNSRDDPKNVQISKKKLSISKEVCIPPSIEEEKIFVATSFQLKLDY